jgi:hypothetical protein
MELDDMKSYWKHLPSESDKPADALKHMIKENGHPVLKGIRRQLAIEIAGWLIFLIVFYDFFDGHKKPLYLNLLVVGAGIFLVAHNLLGYITSRNLHAASNLTHALSHYLARVKTYSVVSVASRLVSTTAVLMFLTDGIQFTREKYVMLAGVLLVFTVQIGWLIRLWIKRIVELEGSVRELRGA